CGQIRGQVEAVSSVNPGWRHGRHEGKVIGQVRSEAAGTDRSARYSGPPVRPPGGKQDPGHGVSLDDVGRSAASVPWSLDALDRGEGRYSHLDRATGGKALEYAERVHCRGAQRLALRFEPGVAGR